RRYRAHRRSRRAVCGRSHPVDGRERAAHCAGGADLVMRIATLDRKLLRDLKRLKAQAIAVSAVLACGVALFVMATGMYGSMERSRDHYYATSRLDGVAGAAAGEPHLGGTDT